MENKIGITREAFSSTELQQTFGLNPATLATLRCQKRGPRFYRVGCKVVYFREDVIAWLQSDPGEIIDQAVARG